VAGLTSGQVEPIVECLAARSGVERILVGESSTHRNAATYARCLAWQRKRVSRSEPPISGALPHRSYDSSHCPTPGMLAMSTGGSRSSRLLGSLPVGSLGSLVYQSVHILRADRGFDIT